jgi:flagellar basal body-associated protein FliL
MHFYKPNHRGMSLVVILIIVVFVIGLGAGGFFFFKMKAKKEQLPTKAAVPFANMDEKLIGFTFSILPTSYQKIVDINKEIGLIDTELSRLNDLEAQYPQQKNIISKERAIWDRTKKSLLNVMQIFEKNIETFYVAYSVNPEKGKELIETKKTELETTADQILQASRTETARIHVEPPLTFMEKWKAKLFK